VVVSIVYYDNIRILDQIRSINFGFLILEADQCELSSVSDACRLIVSIIQSVREEISYSRDQDEDG
jgi:hypothetical protein